MEIINLSQPVYEGMFKYPTDPEPKLERTLAKIEKIEIPLYDESGMSSGAGYEEIKYKSGHTLITARNHLGTHIDAPAHKIVTGSTIDEYPASYFVNTFELLDLTERKFGCTPSTLIRQKDLGEITLNRNIGAIILNTGYSEMLQSRINEKRPISKNEKEELENKFTYLCKEIIDRLKDTYTSLKIIGIDSFSVDAKGSNSEVHRKMFEYGILPIENLWNLDLLRRALKNNSSKKATLYAIPSNITGGDAAPTTAFVQIG